ncbi:hypothetical protein RSOLAG22IIIB_08676 [Rhizoctonia solani]|uniref:Uncharacterized protein n=1 Tax=Rhizoctonia solani TaxID=456999 RepID=A0A0K6FUA5_9AGAM|nr:hypothetical protein RSOLAG22IIIB_08676 [Rhizoctonia solani]
MAQQPNMNHLIKCLHGVLQEVPLLVGQLGEINERLELVERGIEQANRASIARGANVSCRWAPNRIRPILLADGSLPIEPFPRTLEDFDNLNETIPRLGSAVWARQWWYIARGSRAPGFGFRVSWCNALPSVGPALYYIFVL